ncbi:ankyrin repeat and SOCS box protein 1 [Leucoraja erinacea]|uniref:ankyrin repeat and SOCS box protein 1 n=1 Tax=Leucoraja erinaceus TaxID=7782 RepID=UPI0024561F1C|nr:ankyrin repeat and SOCS box protein 1 [Leucoraja erinacea]
MSERQGVKGCSGAAAAEERGDEEEEDAAAAAAGARAGRDLKEWLREQFCDGAAEEGTADTRLHDATYVGDLATVAALLKEDHFRRRINEKSVWCCGWLPCTPLRIAATAGHADCADYLLKQGAEVDLVDVKGQTALYVAVLNGHVECTRILVKAGADPNGSCHHRSKPVYHASRVGRADILKELIKYGANVDVDHHLASRLSAPAARRFTSLGVCPLYISSAYHHLQCFKLLLKAGANPNYNYWGQVDVKAFPRASPICILDAVLRHGCDVQFVKLLIDFGANLNLVNWEGLDAETMGRMKVKEEALQFFRTAKGTPRTLTSSCRVVIRRALGKFRLDLIQTLPIPDTVKIFLLHEDT